MRSPPPESEKITRKVSINYDFARNTFTNTRFGTRIYEVMTTTDTITYFFIAIAAIAFIRLIWKGDDEGKKFQKIFGGLILLAAALLSNNGWVMAVSIFISGLIVASEDFMRFLAAIMRTNGDKISDTLMALRTEKATVKEVEKKQSRESKELNLPILEDDPKDVSILKEIYPGITISPAPDIESQELPNPVTRERVEKIKKVESLVQSYLKEVFPSVYEPHMKITNGQKAMIVDGIIRKNNKIRMVVEIRFLTRKSYSILGILITKFREKLVSIGLKKRVLMIVVSEEMTLGDAQSMYESCKAFASLVFFAYKNEILAKIELPQLSKNSSS